MSFQENSSNLQFTAPKLENQFLNIKLLIAYSMKTDLKQKGGKGELTRTEHLLLGARHSHMISFHPQNSQMRLELFSELKMGN